MTSTSTANLNTCQWCGCIHSGKCPQVKAIEYHPNGSIKRVEFFSPGDHVAPVVVQPSVTNPPQPSWLKIKPLGPWEYRTYTFNGTSAVEVSNVIKDELIDMFGKL